MSTSRIFDIQQTSSWPGLSRPSTSLEPGGPKDVDARDERGHDGYRFNRVVLRIIPRDCQSGAASLYTRHSRFSLTCRFARQGLSQEHANPDLDRPNGSRGLKDA
jgi:hypothetical protein